MADINVFGLSLYILAFAQGKFTSVTFTATTTETVTYTFVSNVEYGSQIECSQKCADEQSCVAVVIREETGECQLLQNSRKNSTNSVKTNGTELDIIWMKDEEKVPTQPTVATADGNNCPLLFAKTAIGCFIVEEIESDWEEAEEYCNLYGPEVHLVSLDSELVISFVSVSFRSLSEI